MRLRETFTIAGRTFPAPIWIVGPDVIENAEMTLAIARKLAAVAREHRISLVFKASYEKANRTSRDSFRGPGLEQGLEVLARVRGETGLPVTSDVHGMEQVAAAARVLDVIQIPAFLSRQNALLECIAQTGKVVNLKKGQFLSPWEVASRIEVLRDAGAADPWITERGVSFGYQRLINDFRVVPITHDAGAALIFDATHSVQKPAGEGRASGGERRFIPVLARAAAAAGADGFFFEVHPDPARALCDGPNALPLDRFEDLLAQLLPLVRVTREIPDLDLS